jgi:hypothetical protein
MSWWLSSPERLETETHLMKQKFPQFQLGTAIENKIIKGSVVVKNGQKYWYGILKTCAGNIYTSLIVYPDHYPGQEIRSFIIEPLISSVSHRYGDGRLCLYSNDHGGRGQGHGKGMTAVSYVGWTAAWLHAYEIFNKTGKWPENNFFNR